MRRWVVIGEWDGPEDGVFCGRNELTPTVVLADTEDEAARAAIQGMNVLSLRYGVRLQVLPVLDDGPRYRAKYAHPGEDARAWRMPSDLRIEKDITEAIA